MLSNFFGMDLYTFGIAVITIAIIFLSSNFLKGVLGSIFFYFTKTSKILIGSGYILQGCIAAVLSLNILLIKNTVASDAPIFYVMLVLILGIFGFLENRDAMFSHYFSFHVKISHKKAQKLAVKVNYVVIAFLWIYRILTVTAVIYFHFMEFFTTAG